MLTLDHISFHYEKSTRLVLENISYTFEAGKCYAIVGKSGSGKTTLISLISGLEAPTSGEVRYKDTPSTSSTSTISVRKTSASFSRASTSSST